MPKIVILLCTVLIATAINAVDVADALATKEALIRSIIYATKHKFDDIKSKAVEYVANVEEAAQTNKKNVVLQVKYSKEEAEKAIDELALKDDGSEITEFNKLFSRLEQTGVSAIVNTAACIDDRLVTERRYVQNIITRSDNVLANLTAIREEVVHCSDDNHGIKTAAAIIECIDVAGLKAAWIETNAVPSLITEMTNITNSFDDFYIEIVQCEIIGGTEDFLAVSLEIFMRIDRIKHETHPGTEKATTEKASSSETTLNTKDAST